jgi:RNA polymerase sigma-70 factor (ECF subfamily)
MDEATLEGMIQRARAGDADAFAEIYRHFIRRVFGLCRHMLGSDAAEDAASEVFMRVRQSMSSYNPALPFDRWLLSIASHYCVDLWRRCASEKRWLVGTERIESGDVQADASLPLDQMVTEEQRGRVRSAVESLPQRYRHPLVLRYYSEMTYDEIASALGLTRRNVATLIFRAKKELRRKLSKPLEEQTP